MPNTFSVYLHIAIGDKNLPTSSAKIFPCTVVTDVAKGITNICNKT